MTITSQTTISKLIRHNPEVIDAIAGLSPRFNKLRNPVLRKLMAARTTIAMAAKVGGCKVEDLVNRILPLGFEYQNQEIMSTKETTVTWATNPDAVMDVRPVLANGNDPLKEILKVVGELKTGQILKIINSFEPAPLIKLLERQGYECFVQKSPKTFDTYIRIKDPVSRTSEPAAASSFDDYYRKFHNSMVEIDVRGLEMPWPMKRILEETESLPPTKALWVHHKKVPVYLLPELTERGFVCCIRELPGDVQLLIFRMG